MIGVYADWNGLPEPKRMGFLHSRQTRMRELFEFEYDPLALTDPCFNRLQLDPEIQLFTGAQYPTQPKDKFGVFGDSSPDRWGRLLMKRRLERDIRAGSKAVGTRLYESDYLLGAGYFRLSLAEADEVIENFIGIVGQWRTIANRLELPLREQERIAEAFRVAEN
ncbi:MAG: toxin HipA [Serratia inhibens]|uniref:toxin HipA n=1 Tax=Serratia inhibens TaxID=2338073 RepID=UPI003C7BC651